MDFAAAAWLAQTLRAYPELLTIFGMVVVLLISRGG
jgi:hypothetical protein